MSELPIKTNSEEPQNSLTEELEKARKQIIFLENSLNGLQLEYENVERRIERYDLTLIKSYQKLAEKSGELEGLTVELSQIKVLKAELEYSQLVIRSAEKWQKRSFIKRLFHKWRAPGRKADHEPLDQSALFSPAPQGRRVLTKELTHILGVDLPLPDVSLSFGIVAQNCILEELQLCLNSLGKSLSDLTSAISSSIYLNDCGLKYNREGLNIIISKQSEGDGAVTSHNMFMRDAFSHGSDFYFLVNERGSCASSTLRTLLQHALASDKRSLIEAVRFPMEHSKGYDFDTFETPYILPYLTVVPKAIYQSIGPLDDRLELNFATIDYSWRARQAGFGVKTCPRSLYFHPVGRVNKDSRVLESYLVSGLILSRKYGNLAFERKMRAQALLSEIPLPSIPTVEMIKHATTQDDFDKIDSYEENLF